MYKSISANPVDLATVDEYTSMPAGFVSAHRCTIYTAVSIHRCTIYTTQVHYIHDTCALYARPCRYSGALYTRPCRYTIYTTQVHYIHGRVHLCSRTVLVAPRCGCTPVSCPGNRPTLSDQVGTVLFTCARVDVVM
jgi:hypothetical protein